MHCKVSALRGQGLNNRSTYKVKHGRRKVGMLVDIVPRHREGFRLPLGADDGIADLCPPFWLVGELLNKTKHADLADQERGGFPVVLVASLDREVLARHVVQGKTAAGQLEGADFGVLELSVSYKQTGLENNSQVAPYCCDFDKLYSGGDFGVYGIPYRRANSQWLAR